MDVLPVMLLLGSGFGAAMPALTAFAMSGAAPEYSGLASDLFNTTQQVGGASGLAALATLAISRTQGLLADGQSTAPALTGSYHLAFAAGAGFVVAAIALAVILLRPEGDLTGDGERARTCPATPRLRPGYRCATGLGHASGKPTFLRVGSGEETWSTIGFSVVPG